MKTSNGIKNNFLKLFVLINSFLIFPAVSFAQVSKIVFITDPQTIKPSILSAPITIQTQDSSGSSFQVAETFDLEFISSSPTGEFLGSTGNPVTAYMSKNTANRTFYYKDAAEGMFTLTINAKGRETGASFSASQSITISNSSVTLSENENSGEVLGTSIAVSGSQSSVESTTNVSSPGSQLEVLSGTDRVTAAGSPMVFQATLKKNTTSSSPRFDWSFGDGNVGVGPLVSHTYKYPGDYVVVLNASAGNIFSVSRFKVKVTSADISVSDGGGYLEISNNGNTEINLFNWKIESEGKGFIFQPNTILLPHSSVKFDKRLFTMKGGDNSPGISLKNYSGEEVFRSVPMTASTTSEMAKNLDDMEKDFLTIKAKIKGAALAKADKKDVVSGGRSLAPASSTQMVLAEKDSISSTKSEEVIYEAPKKDNILGRAWKFFINVFH